MEIIKISKMENKSLMGIETKIKRMTLTVSSSTTELLKVKTSLDLPKEMTKVLVTTVLNTTKTHFN